MSGPGNVDSWFEFIIWLAIAAGALVSAVAAVRGAQHGRANREATDEVREQVSNDHTSNMRDDLDRVDEKVDTVDTKVDRLTGTVDAMSRMLDNFMRESRAQMARQDIIAAKHHPDD